MASYAPRRSTLELPRPLRTAAPLAALAVGALALDADPRLPWVAGVVGAAFFTCAAAVRALQARRELGHLRRIADRLIVQAGRHAEVSELIRWRSQELTSNETRAALSREIEHTLSALSPDRLPSASPLNRPAARRNADLLRVLANRLRAAEPVAARGVLLAQRLLRDADSPLYAERPNELLARAVTRVLGALEP